MTDHITPDEIAKALERHQNDYDDNEPCCRRCDGRWPCDAHEALTALVEMREELDQILQAWGPKLIKYPSNKECEAVNRTPEFVVGRNAAMETACTMLRIVLEGRG